MDWNNVKFLSIDPFGSSSKKQQYIVSYAGKHFEVSEAVAELIQAINSSDSKSDAIEQFSKSRNTSYSEESINKLIVKYINPILESEGKEAKQSFIFKKEIFSAKRIEPITSKFSIAFNPLLAAILCGVILLLESAFLLTTDSRSHSLIGETGPEILLASGLIFFLSTIFHELGHASACKYFKIDHGHIGIGLYLHFPVFYADVSNVWKLPRLKRVIVDLAGIYFQLIFLVPLIIIYLYDQNELVKYIIFAINLSFLFDLNPFFKFDGYWVCSDLLGIPNLRDRTIETIIFFTNKIRGQANKEKPFLFSIGVKEKIGMILYSVLINIFFAYYFFYTIPSFLFAFIKSFPHLINQILHEISTGNLPSLNLMFSSLIQISILTLVALFIYRVLSFLVVTIKNMMK
jgi:putative peptide zinc metalloprotease protein